MKLKKCQLDTECVCVNKGEICLKTKEEKLEYNRIVSDIQRDLEKIKFLESGDDNYECN